MQRLKRIIHAERIGSCESVKSERILNVGHAGRKESPHVHVGSQPDAGRVRHGIRSSALLVVEGLHGAQRIQRGDRRSIRGDGAGVVHGHTFTGVRINEDAFSIQFRDLSNQFHSFWKNELTGIVKEPKRSIMPSYQSILTAAELDDVLAYLESLQGRP